MIKPVFSYRWTRPWKNIWSLVEWCQNFVLRGLNGWCPSDVWNWDWYQCNINIGALTYLKKYQHGYPCGLDEDADSAEKQWDENLDKMIAGFKAVQQMGDCEWEGFPERTGDFHRLEKERDEGLQLYAKWFEALWD